MDIDTDSLEGPKPHDVLWFPDGNIVLKTDTYLFKVYKGLLSMNSSFFRDMFELPHVGSDGHIAEQDGSGGVGKAHELYEGLPLVTMVDDDGDDVAHLLRAIYEWKYYDRYDNDTPLDAVVALLKLSTKYDFKDIRKDIIIKISSLYPRTLQEFDSFQEKCDSMLGAGQLDCHAALLAAAFETNADVLLPILYYSASCISIDDIFAEIDSMSPECFRILFKGREGFDTDVSRLVAELPDYLLEDVSASGCSEARPCLKRVRYRHLSELIGMEFHVLRGQSVVEDHLSAVCKQCSSFVAKSIDNKREAIWAKIPSYFDCPGWDVIQEKLEEIKKS